MKNKIFPLFKKSFKDFYSNPVIAVPTVLLLLFMVLLSQLSEKINYSLTKALPITLWLIFFSLISLSVSAFALAGLIGMSSQAIRKKSLSFLPSARRFWIKNLAIIVIIFIAFKIFQLAALFLSLRISQFLELALRPAQLVFFLFLFASLAGFIIFFTYASFYLVIRDLSIKKSIKNSFKFVRTNYLTTLAVIVTFFIGNELVRLAGDDIAEIISAGFLVPYLSLILSRLIIKK